MARSRPFLLLAALASTIASPGCESSRRPVPPPIAPTTRSAAATSVEELLGQRQQLDESVWAQEKVAQQYEAVLVQLWDDLLAADRDPGGDKFAVFKRLGLDRIVLADAASIEPLPHAIEAMQLGKDARELSRADWHEQLDAWKQEGYRLVQSEWHHARFEILPDGRPRSVVSMAMHVTARDGARRIALFGEIDVEWQASGAASPIPQSIDTSRLQVLVRDGPPAFRKLLDFDPPASAGRPFVHPLIVADLDGDDLDEIVLSAANLRLKNHGDFRFQPEPFVAMPPPQSKAGLVADLDGDQHLDYLTIAPGAGVLLYPGDAAGQFTRPPVALGLELTNPQVTAAGDVDGDGDLDLWIAQHKAAYLNGQMPTPFYDANDGFPAHLLRNDGGRFVDVTESSGLGRKRYRRTYGSSFVDLDQDHDLDLVVVSDYAGVDLYRNDGTGQFTDVTNELVDEPHNFGMSSSYADFDLDGNLDFYVTGMASNTVRRLEHLQLGRKDQPDVQRMRSVMGYGSRMYVADGSRFVEPPFRDQVARTGWTWGSTAFDFDNDGDRDLYLANGHSSGKSTKDHCWHFWCHDVYTNSSEVNPVRSELFKRVLAGFEDASESWDGYQKNVLLMNVGGKRFVNIAFLMGVAEQYDARAVVGADFDNDGRVDLAVVEYRVAEDRERLHVYRNEMTGTGHWIGLRVGTDPDGNSPVGARVTLITENGRQPAQIVTGDSYSAQHPPVVHFGLGDTDTATALEVRWSSGQFQRIESPPVDRYHHVGGR